MANPCFAMASQRDRDANWAAVLSVFAEKKVPTRGRASEAQRRGAQVKGTQIRRYLNALEIAQEFDVSGPIDDETWSRVQQQKLPPYGVTRSLVEQAGARLAAYRVSQAQGFVVTSQKERSMIGLLGADSQDRQNAPSHSPNAFDPSVSRPTARELHLRFVLTDGLRAFKQRLPRVAMPSRMVAHSVEALRETSAATSQDSISGERFMTILLNNHVDTKRLYSHSQSHELWGNIANWLSALLRYASTVRATTAAWWDEITRAMALAGLAPSPPSDLFETLMLLVTNRPLIELKVERRQLIRRPASEILDLNEGHGGYLVVRRSSRSEPSPLGFVQAMSLQRVPLPNECYSWSREAGEIQEAIRQRVAGTSEILDICTQYAALSDTRKLLVEQASDLKPLDLAEGHCDLCDR